jgi:hypothetical protein
MVTYCSEKLRNYLLTTWLSGLTKVVKEECINVDKLVAETVSGQETQSSTLNINVLVSAIISDEKTKIRGDYICVFVVTLFEEFFEGKVFF